MPTQIGVVLIIFAVVLMAIGVVLRSRRSKIEQPTPSRRRRRTVELAPPVVFDRIRPTVIDLHLKGEEVQVVFDVPVGTAEDQTLVDLLLDEAVEVVREKSHSLPLHSVTTVVAMTGRGDAVTEVGRKRLSTPGQLPPQLNVPSVLELHHIGHDPLDKHFKEGDQPSAAGVVGRTREDELPAVGTELRLPRAIDIGLRTQGIDPATMSAGALVVGTLGLFGYLVEQGAISTIHTATKGGQSTYLLAINHAPGEHPELDERLVREFVMAFAASNTHRGLLVTDKYGGHEIHAIERREPRIRFLTRERLQKFIDGMSLS